MEIRQIKKSEWEKLKVFNEAEYGVGHILTNKIYYDWQFDNFTNKDKKSYSTLGSFGKDGELLGTFGMFSLPYNFYGKTVSGNCLANLIVKENLRSLGYGYLLLEKAAAGGDLAIDHTINANAWPMFMKAGWQGEDLKRFLYIINPKNALYDLPASKVFNSTDASWELAAIKEFGGETDEFWRKNKARYPITIERTAEYMNWRYAKNPLAKYEIFSASRNSELKGILVLRIEEVSDKSGEMGVRIGRIIDLVADPEADKVLLSGAVEFCRKNKIDLLDYFSSGNFHDQSLASAGFVDAATKPFDAIPMLLRPINLKRIHLNFAVKTATPTGLKDWYTTKGGGDQDRP